MDASKHRPGGVILAVGLLMIAWVAAGCASPGSGSAGSPTTTRILKGWVNWLESMPGGTYDTTSANFVCQGDLGRNVVQFTQIVIHAPNGDVLGAGAIDKGALETHQDATLGGGSTFWCTVRWSAPPLPVENAYTIDFAGRSTVVNGATADQGISLETVA